MENQAIIKDVIILMEQSGMDDQEKTFWSVLIPTMKADELEKFKAILEKEVNKLKEILKTIQN